MIELTTLVPMVVSALVPYFARGAQTIADKSAAEIYEQRGKIWDSVKGVFVEDDLTTLNLFADDPENPETQAELRGELKQLLKASPENAAKLEELVVRLKDMSSEIINEQVEGSIIDNEMKRGEGKASISNKGISGSRISNKIN